ncbi:hypothetical protein [Candidatus Lokiarchaeum ossiferum]|uniref:hypothetical protein n=1 Tax=Candidatus Lokiarchaeum ossiferum TaxID=2951803 RepID=UPI00352F2212
MAEKIAEKLINWLPNVFKAFKNFKPEMQKFQINYREKTSEIYYKVNMGSDSIRKKLAKIEVPNSGNYSFKAIFDEGWTDYSRIVKIDRNTNSYVFSPKDLPSSQFYMVILKGLIDPDGLKRIVHVQPAANQSSTKIFDKYWLQASIRDIRMMENLYKALEIEDINCGVNIAIDKYFSAEIPKELRKTAEIIQKFMLAAQGKDRRELFTAWNQYRTMSSSDSNLEKLYENIFDKVKLKEFISVDQPFQIGKVGPHKMENYLPISFKTEALTKLTLDNPQASGYLKFHKKKFTAAIDAHVEKRNSHSS